MKVRECNEQDIEIPIDEYKHLKECKAQLIKTHELQIIELNSEMMTAGISAIINNNIINTTSLTNNTLTNRIIVYLKNLIKKIIHDGRKRIS